MPRYDLGSELKPWDNHTSIIFPVKPPNRVRDRPMKVLALGMSRSGTDSLRTALEILGYNGVYHGFEMLYNETHDHEFWIPWLKKKHVNVDYNNPKFLSDLTATQFDKALGQYEAVTDAPCYCFSHELLVAYPAAKAILNRRKDMEQWRSSFTKVYEDIIESKALWLASHFEPQLYWIRRHWLLCYVPYFKYDFPRYGLEGALAHYRNTENVLTEQNREYLDWSPEDGWEPLCRFLGKEVPREPFPYTNVGIEGVKKKYHKGIDVYFQKAMIHAAVVFGLVGISVWYAIHYRIRYN